MESRPSNATPTLAARARLSRFRANRILIFEQTLIDIYRFYEWPVQFTRFTSFVLPVFLSCAAEVTIPAVVLRTAAAAPNRRRREMRQGKRTSALGRLEPAEAAFSFSEDVGLHSANKWR